MSERDSFIAEIMGNPDDAAARLVYSDWLTEQGDPRGEFIQLQIQRQSLTHGSSAARRLRSRGLELLREHENEWIGEISNLVERFEFRRGFVSHVKLSMQKFLKDCDHLFSEAPVDSVELRLGGSRAKKFAECHHVGKLRSINLNKCRIDHHAGALFQSPFLSRLQQFRLYRCRIDDRAYLITA